MRTVIFLMTLALSVSSLAAEMTDEEILREIKLKLWPQAYRTQDVKLLDSLLHDSFEMLDNKGERSTKQQELDYIRNNPWKPGEFEYHIDRLQIYQGRFAVIDGRGITSDYSYASSNFLIKEDGRWQAIASHVSGVTAKEIPDEER